MFQTESLNLTNHEALVNLFLIFFLTKRHNKQEIQIFSTLHFFVVAKKIINHIKLSYWERKCTALEANQLSIDDNKYITGVMVTFKIDLKITRAFFENFWQLLPNNGLKHSQDYSVLLIIFIPQANREKKRLIKTDRHGPTSPKETTIP